MQLKQNLKKVFLEIHLHSFTFITSYHKVTSNVLSLHGFMVSFYVADNMANLQKLFVEQEFSELGTLTSDHFSKCCNLASQVTLSLVLFLEEFTSKVIDKLLKLIINDNRTR